MKREILANGIVVYRNAIPHLQELINNLKKTTYWEKWYDVGQQITIAPVNKAFSFKNAPTKEEWDSKVKSWETSMFFKDNLKSIEEFKWFDLEEAFYKTTTDYLSLFPLKDVPNWFRGGTNFLKYDAKKEEEVTTEASGTLNYSLPFHTDYHYPTSHKPGIKPFITVTMYFNDDYEGGDIEFRIFDKHYTNFRIEGNTMIDLDTNKVVEGFNYKPQAGDIVIFPSKLPYYHGVKKVTKGQKLLARTFWMYNPETPDPKADLPGVE